MSFYSLSKVWNNSLPTTCLTLWTYIADDIWNFSHFSQKIVS